MGIKINSKKAQIGTTITWVVASIIILFLMVGFIVISISLSGKSKTEISFEESVENLDSQRELMKILNSPTNIEESKNVKELIKLWFSNKSEYKDLLDNEMKKVLKDFEYDSKGSNGKVLEHVAFTITIYSFKEDKKFIESYIEANNFHYNYCIGKPQCRDLAGVYVPVSDSEMVYIILWGSKEEIR